MQTVSIYCLEVLPYRHTAIPPYLDFPSSQFALVTGYDLVGNGFCRSPFWAAAFFERIRVSTDLKKKNLFHEGRIMIIPGAM